MPASIPVAPDLAEACSAGKKAVIPMATSAGVAPPTTGQLWPRGNKT